MASPSSALQFIRVVGKLKNTKRTGWVRKGVPLPESVSDHMYRMAMFSFLIEDPKIDKVKCMKMSLVHDLAEALVGDITPHCGVSEEEKFKLEEEAFLKIERTVENKTIGAEMVSLWREYEAQSTAEAHLVKDFDKFEMIEQADAYEEEHDVDLSDFFSSTAGKFRHPMVVGWVSALEERRGERRSKAAASSSSNDEEGEEQKKAPATAPVGAKENDGGETAPKKQRTQG